MRGYTAQNMLRHFEKLLRGFPASRLSRKTATLRIHAVSPTEPPLFEQSFEEPWNPDDVLNVVREYAAPDSGVYLDTRWDLWQFDGEWKLLPSPVTLACFGPEYEHEDEDHLRVEFGIDTHFLPQPDLPNHLFMARSNIRSLLHLVHELDNTFVPEQRRLWTESGENFAEKLQSALEETDQQAI